MFKIFANAFKVKDIRKKIFYVLLIIAIYRLGCAIPLPGMDMSAWLGHTGGASTEFSLQTLLGGGKGTLFAMGIGPFITASIVMQLMTVAIPKLEQLQKEGQDGRDKINQWTRVVAVFLAVLQGSAEVYGLAHTQGWGVVQNDAGEYELAQNVFNLLLYDHIFIYALAVLTLVAGTIFVMWLSEVLTEKGFGNGSSFIIFSNILSSLPGQIGALIDNIQQNESTQLAIKIALYLVAFILFIAIIAFAVLIQDGERRIPVQYSKKMVGRQMVGGQASHIPLKVNIAGVMSIIFAVSIIQTPQMLYGFFRNDTLAWLVENLKFTKPLGAVVYIVLIFAFTFFYTSFAINPNEMADNIKKNGGFIPGIRPGKPTSDYITATVNRLSWIGATFYAIIAMAPVVLEMILGISVGFGGTTLLIVSSVALEIVKQLESLLLMKHYKGFLS